jgi:hypothetical protein
MEDSNIPVQQEIIILPADECKTLKLGWVIYDNIGELVITQSAFNIAMGRKRVRCVLVE